MKKITIILFVFLILTLIGCVTEDKISKNLQMQSQNIDNANKNILIYTSPTPTKSDVIIKPEVIISIPFALQFPASTLDYPYQEGCEEASIIMAKAYLDSNTDGVIPNEQVDNTLISMVDWQNINWGGHYDLNARDTLKLMRDYYNISNGEVVTITHIDDIKRILSDNKMIIAPTFGMKLDNPYFTAPGPAYHMLVIKGYNDSQFITNDPGIGLGKDFVYSHDNLYDAIHDLPDEARNQEHYIKNHHELMENTPKNIIVFSK